MQVTNITADFNNGNLLVLPINYMNVSNDRVRNEKHAGFKNDNLRLAVALIVKERELLITYIIITIIE